MIAIAYQHEMGGGALARALHAAGITSWMYLGEDTTWRIRAEQELSGGVRRIPMAGPLDRASQDLRQPYIDLIGSLSLRNNNFPWWSSELAAKNPYSYLFLRICLQAASRSLLDRDRDWPGCVVCSTPALARGVEQLLEDRQIPSRRLRPPLAHRLTRRVSLPGRATLRSWLDPWPVVPRLGTTSSLYREYLETRLEYRRQALRSGGMEEIPGSFAGEKTILFFTWVDGRNFTADGKYRDPYFGALPDLLKQKGYRVGYMAQVLPGFPFLTAVERLKECGERIYLPEMFLEDGDATACRKESLAFAPDIPPGTALDRIPLRDLLREQVEEGRRVHAGTLRYRPLVRRMAEAGITPGRIIHPCEGHSWEAALAWSVREFLPGTRITGYDNLTFSRMVTSMYPAACEFGIRPLPDRIVTNGPLSCRILRREGWPRERVAAGCGLRHGYLWSGAPLGRVPSPGSPPVLRILVATAIGLGDSVELVAKAARAFGGEGDHEVTVKCHPLVSVPEVKAALGTLADAGNIRFSQEPMDVLLPRADLLLYTYTTVCFEALRYGVIPVCVRAENFLNMDKLDGAPGLREVATDEGDLRRIAGGIRAMGPEERARRDASAQEAVREALAPVTEGCVDPFVSGDTGHCGETG